MPSAAAAKANAVLNTHMRLILHSSALPVCQYMLNTTHPSMNQHTVSSHHQRARIPAHPFLKRTTKYLLSQKLTHCSTYTTPDLLPTLAACLAVCKGIQSNKHPPVKSSEPTPNIQLWLLSNHNLYSKPAASSNTFYTILPALSFPPPATQYTALQLPNPMQCLTRICATNFIHAHFLRANMR